MASNRNIAQPEGDLTSSTTSNANAGAQSNTPGFPAVAEGDLASSTQSERFTGCAHGSAGAQDNHADAEYNGRIYQDGDGPVVDMPALVDERPLHEVHLGTVGASATKPLLEGLKNVTQLTPPELADINKCALRRDAVYRTLELWSVKEGNRTVGDLVQLLHQAGGPNDTYADLVARVRLCPP